MSHGRGLALGAGAFLAWGLLSPGNEILLYHYSPLWMQAVRSFLASLALVLWVGPRGVRDALRVFRHPRLTTGLFFGTFLSFGLFVLSQERVEATFTTLGFYTAPLWTAIMARLLIGERVGPWFGPAVAAMLVGAWLALTGGGALPLPDPLGLAMATGSGLTWALFAVMLRRSSADVEWKPLLLASMLLALPLFIILALVFEPPLQPGTWDAITWRWTFIQVAIPTLVAMGLFQNALRHAPAGQVNMLVGIELAATVFFAWLLLGDTFSGLQLLGLAAVLAAVSGYLWQRTMAVPPPATPA